MTSLAELLANTQRFLQPGAFCFQGSTYPLLFFTGFLSKVTYQKEYALQHIDLTEVDLKSFCSSLSMSFLGQSIIYWCKDSSVLSETAQKQWYNFIAQYQGPHTILFFAPSSITVQTSLGSITLPDTIQIGEYQQLYTMLFDKKFSNLFIKKLFQRHSSVPLEVACLLMEYQYIAGKTGDLFLEHWLDKLISEKRSLFTLSNYFFAKQSKQFFALWANLVEDYPPEFWVSYWAEQLWQAFCFVLYARKQSLLEAKKITNRLPFSFAQFLWQSYTLKELTHAHQFLYTIDYNLKNGGSAAFLELFYIKFFANQFSSVDDLQ